METRTLQNFTADYIESFDNFIKNGLKSSVKYIKPAHMNIHNKSVRVEISRIEISKPHRLDDKQNETNYVLYPWECRRQGLSYTGKCQLTVNIYIDGLLMDSSNVNVGQFPVMVRSLLCNLNKMDEKHLVKHNEEYDELGGYFIVSGNQVMTRYLVQARRNFPIVQFKTLKISEHSHTGHLVYIRCVRDDEVSSEMKLLWKKATAPDVYIQIGKRFYSLPLPLVLKALQNKSPMEMYSDVPKTGKDLSQSQTLCLLFNDFPQNDFPTNFSCLEYLGSRFRNIMGLPESMTNCDAGRKFVDEYVAIHLTDYREKYDLLLYMLAKLQSFVNNRCASETVDTINFQELLTSGSLIQQTLILSINNFLSKISNLVDRKMTMKKNSTIIEAVKATFRNNNSILSSVKYLLSTGDLRGNIIPGIKQNNGLRIMVDNINFYRYLANFRSFHRGAFFTTMKSSSIRKLLPESWGFVCPVHSPDGSPCGLLNHLSINAYIQSFDVDKLQRENLERLIRKSIISVQEFMNYNFSNYIYVMMDGKIMGFVENERANILANMLRYRKVMMQNKEEAIPETTEVVLVERTNTASQFPGLYLFTTPGRFIRPVYNINYGHNVIEKIGTLEQSYLDIACRGGSVCSGGDAHLFTTHQELSLESIYSFTASFTPFQNYNPSTRNLFQCQMSKQTIGHTYYSSYYRADNKLYCLMLPQRPIVRNHTYDEFHMEERPIGYNAVVATASYTAYDMEDAMVISKASIDRGLGRAAIVKHIKIDLVEDMKDGDDWFLGTGGEVIEGLDWDGLPAVGQFLIKNAPAYSQYCPQRKDTRIQKYKFDEDGWVTNVSLNGSRQRATISVLIRRNSDIGDKFASRHGQKGVNSLQIAQIDLPYDEEGISPDQIFNPHSYPSRMTMGMIIETIAGKVAALTGRPIDSTAFQSHENIIRFRQQLADINYDPDALERFANGYTGRSIDAEMTMGVIYYQRLRHMVGDKFQVRSVGRIDIRTRQPVKGRKVGGGIRLGEMERDAILAHGAVFSLQDRFVDCSPDKIRVRFCPNCHSFIHTYFFEQTNRIGPWNTVSNVAKSANKWRCKFCESMGTANELLTAYIPAVTRHLLHELTILNIRAQLTATPIDANAI